MSIKTKLKAILYGECEDINSANRDKWVIEHLRELPAGTKILDAGGGRCNIKNIAVI